MNESLEDKGAHKEYDEDKLSEIPQTDSVFGLKGKWILNTMVLTEQKNHIKLDQDPVRQWWQLTSLSISHRGPIKASELHPPFIN